jgi:sarcosine oxidase subunit beta
VTADEAGTLVPGLATEGLLGGSWCAEDGFFDRPQAVVAAFAQAVGRLGVVTEIRELVAVERQADAWRLRFRDGAEAEAGAVVLAAGTETPSFGIDLPIQPEPRHLFYSDPIRERLLEPLVVAHDRDLAAKHLADGRVLVSDLSAASSETPDRWRARARAALETLLPRLQHVGLPLLVSGAYDVTPDRQAIVGALDDGLVVAAGFSGHGFMLAPEVGCAVADLVTGGAADPLLYDLRPERFEAGELVPETLVV